jgi:AraC-like DNA-binding protein
MTGEDNSGLLENRGGEARDSSRRGSGGGYVQRSESLEAIPGELIPEVQPRPPAQRLGSVDLLNLLFKSSACRSFVSAYQRATGLPLRAVPAPAQHRGAPGYGHPKLELCRLLRRRVAGRLACEKCLRKMSQRLAGKKGLCTATCFAGLLEIAVPVSSGSEPIATLLVGPVRKGPWQRKDWQRIAAAAGQAGPRAMGRLRRAYELAPVMDGPHLRAACRLLKFFAQTLEERIPGLLLSNTAGIPLAILKAKEYIATHAAETMAEPEVARHAGLSVPHFCKVFKASAGLTFTEFVARTRTETAKALLRQNGRRIAEIAFDSGFGSVATFNRTFKRLVGKSPSEYKGAPLEGGLLNIRSGPRGMKDQPVSAASTPGMSLPIGTTNGCPSPSRLSA